MPWNVWLANWLIETGRWEVMSYFFVTMVGIMVLAVIVVQYCERLRDLAYNGEWAEQAAARLLMDLHDRVIRRVAFDFRSGRGQGRVHIEGKSIDFICDCCELSISYPRDGDSFDMFKLFAGHSSRPALMRLMRCMQELAEINETWLDYRKEKRFIEFLRSAEIVPFKKVA